MKRLGAAAVLGFLGVLGACGSGSQGPAGPAGQNGMDGANGEAGATGPAGSSSATASTPSVSGITPPRAFLARTAEITVSGYGTSWSATTTVDFGTGVTVNKITLASPTALVADVTIAKTATTGVRDVTVKDGTNTETYKGVFNVLSPISVAYQGTVAQGSVVLATITDLDASTPFDTTIDQNTGYPSNLALTVPAGVTPLVFAATDFSASAQLNIDVPAAAGTLDLDLVSGPTGATTNVDFPAPKSLMLAARTPTALMAGTPATGTTTTIYESNLYSFTPASAALTILDFSVSTTSSTATPSLAVLGSDGTWSGQLAFGTAQPATPAAFSWLSSASTPFYAITIDYSGANGQYSAGVATTAPGSNGATTANDGTKATAINAGTLPFVLTGGDLSVSASGDWVKITATANQTLHLQTVGDSLTDVAVSVYDTSGVTQVGSTIDTGAQADGTVQVTTAGTYYVVYTPGQFYAPPDTTYQAIIR